MISFRSHSTIIVFLFAPAKSRLFSFVSRRSLYVDKENLWNYNGFIGFPIFSNNYQL